MRTSDANAAPRADFVSTVAQGLEVLREFSPDSPELGVGELARRRGWDQRRTQRLVSTLFALGALEQDEETRKYRPGVAVVELCSAVLDELAVRRCAEPVMRDLSRSVGYGVNLAVRSGLDAMLISCVRAPQSVLGLEVYVGDRRPVHLSSLGKAILAAMTSDELAALSVAIDFTAGTEFAVRSSARLHEQLDQVRSRGFATMDQETAVGIRSVAVAIHSDPDRMTTSLNLAVPTPLMTMNDLERDVAPTLLEAAGAITTALGQYSSNPYAARNQQLDGINHAPRGNR